MRSNLLKCAQICSNVLKTAQMCSNMFKSVHNCVQMCPIALNCVQMCSNAVSSIMRSGQLGNRGFKPGFTSPPSSPLFSQPWFLSTFYLQPGLSPQSSSFHAASSRHFLPRPPPPSGASTLPSQSPIPLFLAAAFPTTVSSSVTNPWRPLWPLCEQIQLLPCINIASLMQCLLKTLCLKWIHCGASPPPSLW